jgi:hypothetical protein
LEETLQTGGSRIMWSEDMLGVIKRYYPITETQEVADMISVSARTVANKAKELGIKKDKAYIKSLRKKLSFLATVKHYSEFWKLKNN